MQMIGWAPQVNDANVPNQVNIHFNPNYDWVANRKTAEDQVENAINHLNNQRANHENAQRSMDDIDLSILNQEQNFAVNIVKHFVTREESFRLMIVGGPGTGKSTVIKAITKVVMEQ